MDEFIRYSNKLEADHDRSAMDLVFSSVSFGWMALVFVVGFFFLATDRAWDGVLIIVLASIALLLLWKTMRANLRNLTFARMMIQKHAMASGLVSSALVEFDSGESVISSN